MVSLTVRIKDMSLRLFRRGNLSWDCKSAASIKLNCCIGVCVGFKLFSN